MAYQSETQIQEAVQDYFQRRKDYDDTLAQIEERWVPIVYNDVAEGYYVSNHGRVMSLKSRKIKIHHISKNGLHFVDLMKPDKRTKVRCSVGKLVAMAFVPIPEDLIRQNYTPYTLRVLHKNSLPDCNAPFNLKWGTNYDCRLAGLKKK